MYKNHTKQSIIKTIGGTIESNTRNKKKLHENR